MRWIASSFVLALMVCGCQARREPVPTIAPVPAFALQDQEGRPFRTDDLKGRIWIADFIFTSCPTICPVLTARMRELEERHGAGSNGVGFISFTVDPAVDTPERLRAYGVEHHVDFASWRFVTGPEEEVRRTVKDGFRLALGAREARADSGYDILHAGYLVLIDRNATIRGYYPGSADGVATLEEDLRSLRDDEEE